MASRDQLKDLIDQLPESRLEAARAMLEHHVQPRPPVPEIELMRRRSQDYKQRVLRQFRESRRPGTLGIGGGTGFTSEHGGVLFGRQGFHYWDGKALVHQTLQSFEGLEIEMMERLSFSPDRTKLHCSLEIASGGYTVRHEDEFPLTHAEARP